MSRFQTTLTYIETFLYNKSRISFTNDHEFVAISGENSWSFFLINMTKSFKAGCPACFKALSTDVRSNIVNLIQDHGQLSVMDVVSHFKLTQPTISYHLSELERSGILGSVTKGRQVFYRVNPNCPQDSKKCILK